MLQQLLEPDDDDDENAINAALAVAAEKSGLRKVLAPAAGLSAVAHAILEHRETLMLVPEYRVDVH